MVKVRFVNSAKTKVFQLIKDGGSIMFTCVMVGKKGCNVHGSLGWFVFVRAIVFPVQIGTRLCWNI